MGRGRIRPESIANDMQGTTEEEPKTESPAAAFVVGAKAIVPVLLALIPFGVAFGATAIGSGLSALAALGM
jgi:predicted branched-subunit amino acid permease